MGDLQS